MDTIFKIYLTIGLVLRLALQTILLIMSQINVSVHAHMDRIPTTMVHVSIIAPLLILPTL